MRFKVASLLLAVLLLAGLASCNGKTDNPAAGNFESSSANKPLSNASEQSQAESKWEDKNLNPLTGLYDLNPDYRLLRPVAVMVNNVTAAWGVQTGLQKADIVFETLVEGGITRLMAVYQQYPTVGTVGTIRSARYSYSDLACGLDAIFVHCGSDDFYNTPHMNELGMDNLDLGGGGASAGFRIQNGLAQEHTLYTNGENLASAMTALGWETTHTESKSFCEFNQPDSATVPNGGACNTLTVPFSSSYISSFSYDSENKVYLKSQGGQPHIDSETEKQLSVKNIFVLYTDITYFSDGQHVRQNLSGGNGYYVSEGGYQPIEWSKGDARDPFSFTNEQGEALTANAGNSWVCIAPTSREANLSIG